MVNFISQENTSSFQTFIIEQKHSLTQIHVKKAQTDLKTGLELQNRSNSSIEKKYT